LKYELEKLETVISEKLEPSKLRSQSLDEEQFGSWISIAETERDRIKKEFITKVSRLKKGKHVAFYIRQHQHQLIRLTDLLSHYLQIEEINTVNPNQGKNKINLYKKFYDCLEDLLAYIEHHFTEYFDLQAKVPDSHKIIASRNIQRKLPEIYKNLTIKGVDKELLLIILDPLYQFVQQDKIYEKISFQQLIYLKTMLQELEVLSRSELKGTAINRNIMATLVHLNYNSPKFIGYCTMAIKKHYRKQSTASEQMKRLLWIYKKVRQAQVNIIFCYQPGNENLKDILIEWLNSEIHFLKEHKFLSQHDPGHTNEDERKDFKLQTSLSVSQLAYLIKLLQQTGIIENTNRLELLRFISEVVRTRQTKNISPDSLSSKFYNVEENTRKTLKNIIINLLNAINKN
jgi:hypothetical protein